MAAVPAPRGRGSRIAVAGRWLIDESYNANPESVALALRDLAAAPPPRFALLADMLELGPEGPAFHEGLLPALESLDGVFLVGPLMSALAAPLGPKCLGAWPTLAELDLEPILRVLTPGAQLLVKGSNRFFWQGKTVEALRQRLEAVAY
jgi:UDP-N-acetylmuramyl pentapeptide synthase